MIKIGNPVPPRFTSTYVVEIITTNGILEVGTEDPYTMQQHLQNMPTLDVFLTRNPDINDIWPSQDTKLLKQLRVPCGYITSNVFYYDINGIKRFVYQTTETEI